jgi:DNA-binding response OmpR family regulator
MPNQRRILVVEDDPGMLRMLFDLLTREGFSVLTAENGQQALDLLDRGIRPRLMVIDLMLPLVSGWDVINVVREDRDLRTIPTIVLTGVSAERSRVVADAVFEKPIDERLLVAKVRSLVLPE